jgi:hypothetical protein
MVFDIDKKIINILILIKVADALAIENDNPKRLQGHLNNELFE